MATSSGTEDPSMENEVMSTQSQFSCCPLSVVISVVITVPLSMILFISVQLVICSRFKSRGRSLSMTLTRLERNNSEHGDCAAREVEPVYVEIGAKNQENKFKVANNNALYVEIGAKNQEDAFEVVNNDAYGIP